MQTWYNPHMKIHNTDNDRITAAIPLLEKIEEAGHDAYLVGGCVRELLREAPDVTDIDVATSALPHEVRRIFDGLTVIDTGIKHGTVTVLLPLGSDEKKTMPVEVTTFRTEGDYSDGRHPNHVEFVKDIEEDLGRRDLTVNAMAMDVRGRIIDPFGGRDDLKAGMIRTVGRAELRFREDGLRILRALRFASVFGFEIEEKTSEALHSEKKLLANIAPERIFVELKKLLVGKNAGKVIRQFEDVFEVVIPELGDMRGFDQRNPYHRYDVLEHCIRTMEAVETTPENRDYMKLAALLHDIGKPETFFLDEQGVGHFYTHPQAGEKICAKIMNRLRSDRFTKERVCSLVKYHDLVFEEDERLLKRWMNRYSVDVLLEIIALKKADNTATGNATHELIEKFDRIREMVIRLREDGACFRLEDLAVDGRDLIREGIAEGPTLGKILNLLLEDVIEGKRPNEEAALLEGAREAAKNLTSDP